MGTTVRCANGGLYAIRPTRGDVQPFVALGAGLGSRGHEVILAAPAKYRQLAETAGLEFAEIDEDPDQFHESPEVIAAIRKSPSMMRVGRAMRRSMPKRSPEEVSRVLAQLHQATLRSDAIVTTMFTYTVTFAQPEAPWCSASWWPNVATAAQPALGTPRLPIGGSYNRFTYSFLENFQWRIMRPYINHFRKDRGLPPVQRPSPLRGLGRDIPMFYPYSPKVLPPPADWPARCHVTGYWYWHRKWTPPAQLTRFTRNDPAPLLMTFGSSWPSHRKEESLRWALEAARRQGRRLVMIGGPGKSLPDDVLLLEEADYLGLFPSMCAVIHHGGFGTTAAAVHAGVPQVIIPAYADQPFWAEQMRNLGVAAPVVPFAKLTGERLTAAVSAAVSDQVMGERARTLGAEVRAETGVVNACELLEYYACPPGADTP
jgi:UDP:flavonoid glycosyltransferase YjiC (YdhE family)